MFQKIFCYKKDDIKKSSESQSIYFKSKLHKYESTKNGLIHLAGFLGSLNKLKITSKYLSLREIVFFKKNAKRIFYEKKRGKADFEFKSAHNIGNRRAPAFRAQTVKITDKTSILLCCSNSFLKSCTVHQIYGDMNLENFGTPRTINHCYYLSENNFLKEKDKLKHTHWINLKPKK